MSCEEKKNELNVDNSQRTVDVQRREFLRMSMYVAYATPVIMSVLVEKANAGSSGVYDKNQNCDPTNPDNYTFICSHQQACRPPEGFCQ